MAISRAAVLGYPPRYALDTGYLLACVVVLLPRAVGVFDTLCIHYQECGCSFIAIHRKPHTVLRRFAVQPRTVFSGAPCLKLSVDGYSGDDSRCHRPQRRFADAAREQGKPDGSEGGVIMRRRL